MFSKEGIHPNVSNDTICSMTISAVIDSVASNMHFDHEIQYSCKAVLSRRSEGRSEEFVHAPTSMRERKC